MTLSTPMQERKNGRLFEQSVIIVVVTLLSVVAVPSYSTFWRASRVSEATVQLHEILDAATAYALSHRDQCGTPTWPSASWAGFANLGDTTLFHYTVANGAGGNALVTPLKIVATGREGGRMEGVLVQLALPCIGLEAGRPTIEGL